MQQLNMFDATSQPHLITLFPAAGMFDDFAFFGFLGGFIGYAWYLFTNRNDPKNHMKWWVSLYGVFLSGCLGAMLAIAIDRAIGISILVGLTNQILYMIIVRSIKNKNFSENLKQVLINLLTGGKKV